MLFDSGERGAVGRERPVAALNTFKQGPPGLFLCIYLALNAYIGQQKQLSHCFMNYVPLTQKLTGLLNQIPGYQVITFDFNVDGSACFLMKYEGSNYYEERVSYQYMKQDNLLLQLLVGRIESHFNGWAVRKGIRQV